MFIPFSGEYVTKDTEYLDAALESDFQLTCEVNVDEFDPEGLELVWSSKARGFDEEEVLTSMFNTMSAFKTHDSEREDHSEASNASQGIKDTVRSGVHSGVGLTHYEFDFSCLILLRRVVHY